MHFSDCHKYDIEWELNQSTSTRKLQDVISFCNFPWFGGCQHLRQSWPINWSHRLAPYVPCDIKEKPGRGYGSTLERYWISSAGLAVFVHPHVPLFVGINEKGTHGITLVSKFKEPYRKNRGRALCLKYSLFHCPDIKQTHDYIREVHFQQCKTTPHKDLFMCPIWNIRNDNCSKGMTSGSILKNVNDIIKHGFEPGTLEINDNWTPAHGDMFFDQKRFTEIKAVMKAIKNKGFRILLWVHPFASPKSKSFYSQEPFWMKSHLVDGLTTWNHGPAKILDVTHPTAQLWFETNLNILKRAYYIDGFSFDYGETNYLPARYKAHEDLRSPDSFSKQYVEMAYRVSADCNFGLVKTGVQTQNMPLMISIQEKNSNWGDDGLRAVVPSVLTMTLMGYAFVLPGTVGGQSSKVIPSQELYLRWFETVLLMPGFKVSHPPWYYGSVTVELVQQLLQTRKRYASSYEI